MRAREFLSEGPIPRNAMAQFKAWGFQPAGSGMLKQAFVDKTGHALIVTPVNDETQSFLDWVKFCEQNKNHAHLPNFGGIKYVKIAGEKYALSRAEKLRRISRPLEDRLEPIVNALSFTASGSGRFDDVAADLKQRISYYKPQEQQKILELAQRIDMPGIFDILVKIEQAREKLGWMDDISIDNFMLASNGRLVINDPWA